jgi:histidinol-phosphate phosphatase family protein
MEILLVMGYPASGKTTYVEQRLTEGYKRLNRDTTGGTLASLANQLEAEIKAGGGGSFVLDNTYPTAESRRPILDVAKRNAVPVRCLFLETTIEEAQVNAVLRMIRLRGKLLMPDELKREKDPNLFPPAALFAYRNSLERPQAAEGFAAIETIPFKRIDDQSYSNKAILLDYDGTLRKTKSGAKYPKDPDDIEILPGRAEVLKRYQNEGYRLLGVSNQGDVARGKLTAEEAMACFRRTNELLGIDIEIGFCPHNPAPISCYCRKPMPGIGVAYLEKYKLSRKDTLMVGDMTSDKTFASRVGIRYVDASAFFQ